MKDEYLYWKRTVENFKEQIQEAEATILITSKLLETARKELKKCPKPKTEGVK